MVAKFNLIDLAGSERITEAEKNAERIDEARFINKSLSALGNVVAALRTNSKHANQAALLDSSLAKRSKDQHGGSASRGKISSTRRVWPGDTRHRHSAPVWTKYFYRKT